MQDLKKSQLIWISIAPERAQRKAARFCSQNYNRYVSGVGMIKGRVGYARNAKKTV